MSGVGSYMIQFNLGLNLPSSLLLLSSSLTLSSPPPVTHLASSTAAVGSLHVIMFLITLPIASFLFAKKHVCLFVCLFVCVEKLNNELATERKKSSLLNFWLKSHCLIGPIALFGHNSIF